MHDVWRRKLIYCNITTNYEVTLLPPIVAQTAMEYIRLAVRVITLIFITILTIIFGVQYKKTNAKNFSLTHSNSGDKSTKSNLMSNVQLCQSIILVICFVPLIYFYLNFYMLIPSGLGLVGEPLNQYAIFTDAFVILAPTCNFVFYVTLSKSFRDSAQKLLTPIFCKI